MNKSAHRGLQIGAGNSLQQTPISFRPGQFGGLCRQAGNDPQRGHCNWINHFSTYNKANKTFKTRISITLLGLQMKVRFFPGFRCHCVPIAPGLGSNICGHRFEPISRGQQLYQCCDLFK